MCCKAQRQYWHAQTELLTTPQQAHGVRSNQPSALMEPSQYALREIIGTGHGHRVSTRSVVVPLPYLMRLSCKRETSSSPRNRPARRGAHV